MKIAEKVAVDDGKLLIQQTHDLNPAMERAAMLRQSGAGVLGEKRLVGTIPFALIETWAKEAGVDIQDREAVREIMHRKIMSGEFQKFRVWEGTY
jgi:hypothetical protein